MGRNIFGFHQIPATNQYPQYDFHSKGTTCQNSSEFEMTKNPKKKKTHFITIFFYMSGCKQSQIANCFIGRDLYTQKVNTNIIWFKNFSQGCKKSAFQQIHRWFLPHQDATAHKICDLIYLSNKLQQPKLFSTIRQNVLYLFQILATK